MQDKPTSPSSLMDEPLSTTTTTTTGQRSHHHFAIPSMNENELNLADEITTPTLRKPSYGKQNSFRNIISRIDTLDNLEEQTTPSTPTSPLSGIGSNVLSMDPKVEEMISLISKEYPTIDSILELEEWQKDFELKFLLGPSTLNRYLGGDENNENKNKFTQEKAFLFNKFLFLGSNGERESCITARIIKFENDDWTVKGMSDNSTFSNAFCLKLDGECEIFTTDTANLKHYWLEQLKLVLDIPIFTENQMRSIQDNIQEYLKADIPHSLEDLQLYYTQPIAELQKQPELGESSQYIERKGNTQDVQYATIEKIFQLLTDPREKDSDFLFTFLLTYKSFTTSMDFLKHLINRYNTPPPMTITTGTAENTLLIRGENNIYQEWRKELYAIRLRVCEILYAWIQHFFYNFRKDVEVQNEAHHFINEIIAAPNNNGGKMTRAATIIQKCWQMKRRQRETFSAQQFQRQQQQLEALKKQLAEQQEKKKPSLFQKLFNFNSASESEAFVSASMSISDNAEEQLLDSSLNIAKQLCMIDMEIFNRIQPKECLNQAWSDANRRKNAPNIFNFIERSNHLAIYVSFLILNIDTAKKRAKVIEKFIKIAFVLKELNNFHSMRAIMMALNSNSIYRLKKTWEIVSQKRMTQFSELGKLVSITANSKALREGMKLANLPSLPFMGILLSDLTFFEDGNPDEKDGKINMKKRYQLSSIIKQIVEYQKKHYDFPYHDCKTKWSNIYMAGRYTDDDLYNLSLEKEPRQPQQ